MFKWFRLLIQLKQIEGGGGTLLFGMLVGLWQKYFLNPIPHGIFFSRLPRGGVSHTPPWKINLEVSEPNSFLHSQWYICKELRSKRIFSQLQNSGFGGRSKFGRNVDLRVENPKIAKIYKGKSTVNFFGGPPKINRGTQSALVFFKTSEIAIL